MSDAICWDADVNPMAIDMLYDAVGDLYPTLRSRLCTLYSVYNRAWRAVNGPTSAGLYYYSDADLAIEIVWNAVPAVAKLGWVWKEFHDIQVDFHVAVEDAAWEIVDYLSPDESPSDPDLYQATDIAMLYTLETRRSMEAHEEDLFYCIRDVLREFARLLDMIYCDLDDPEVLNEPLDSLSGIAYGLNQIRRADLDSDPRIIADLVKGTLDELQWL